MHINKILIGLIIANQLLMVFYFTYQLSDTDINLQATKQIIYDRYIRRQPQQENQESEFIIEHEDSDESENEYQDEIPNLDQLHDGNPLEIIGEDTEQLYVDYINGQLPSILNTTKMIYQVRPQNPLSIQKDRNYCRLNTMYLLLKKEIPLTFISDYDVMDPITKILNKVGFDVLPEIPIGGHSQIYLPVNVSIYFLQQANFYKYFEAGTQLLCSLQRYNHIPGSEMYYRNDSLLKLINDSGLQSPKTFIMTNKEQCLQYFKQNDTDQKIYSRQELNHVRLNRKYKNGTLCGVIKDDIIVQEPIEGKSLYVIVFVYGYEMKMYDGHYYTKQNNTITKTDYDNEVSIELQSMVQQFFKSTIILLTQDHRFFELFRIEFIQSTQLYMTQFKRFDSDISTPLYLGKIINETFIKIRESQLKQLQELI